MVRREPGSAAVSASKGPVRAERGGIDVDLGALLFSALAGLSGLVYLVHSFVRAATSMP
jgi:hypothetical protein